MDIQRLNSDEQNEGFELILFESNVCTAGVPNLAMVETVDDEKVKIFNEKLLRFEIISCGFM